MVLPVCSEIFVAMVYGSELNIKYWKKVRNIHKSSNLPMSPNRMYFGLDGTKDCESSANQRK